MTSGSRDEPLRARHFLLADSVSLKTIARQATRLPLPRVFFWRCFTVEKTLSIGLLVLK